MSLHNRPALTPEQDVAVSNALVNRAVNDAGYNRVRRWEKWQARNNVDALNPLVRMAGEARYLRRHPKLRKQLRTARANSGNSVLPPVNGVMAPV